MKTRWAEKKLLIAWMRSNTWCIFAGLCGAIYDVCENRLVGFQFGSFSVSVARVRFFSYHCHYDDDPTILICSAYQTHPLSINNFSSSYSSPLAVPHRTRARVSELIFFCFARYSCLSGRMFFDCESFLSFLFAADKWDGQMLWTPNKKRKKERKGQEMERNDTQLVRVDADVLRSSEQTCWLFSRCPWAHRSPWWVHNL